MTTGSGLITLKQNDRASVPTFITELLAFPCDCIYWDTFKETKQSGTTLKIFAVLFSVVVVVCGGFFFYFKRVNSGGSKKKKK